MTRTQVTALVLVLAMPLVACEQSHIRPHVARHRNYDGGDYGETGAPSSTGSVWPTEERGLFADFRAYRIGDVVTIRIDESPTASGDASTQTRRDGSMTVGAPALLGLTSALTAAAPGLDPSRLFSILSNSAFTGNGETHRGSRLQASMAVRVRERLPNGDLFVEGTKILMVNDEELHIYLSGVIRPQDIEQDNSVASGRVADAEIEFTGRGQLTDNQQPGWLARLLQQIMPF